MEDRMLNRIAASLLALTSLTGVVHDANAQVAACLPTCDPTDVKLFNLSGDALSTLSGNSMELSIVVNPGIQSFSFGVFDGDTGGYWDDGALPMSYILYTDPHFDRSKMSEVANLSGLDMLDDAWSDFPVSVTPDALDPNGSGYAFYRLVIINPDPTALAISNGFKVRTTDVSQASIIMQPQAFAIEPVFGSEELFKVFPNIGNGDVETRTYDGRFDFPLSLSSSLTTNPVNGVTAIFFTVWDGDLDYGSADCTQAYDINDPNTPDDVLPPWAENTQAHLEGIATTDIPCVPGTFGPNGEITTSGNPPDDLGNQILEYAPAVQYTLTAPDGQVFVNLNPSGNQEWEQFRIGNGTEPVPDVADANAIGGLPLGVWNLAVEGLDLSNFAAFRFSTDYLCTTELGENCPQPPVLTSPDVPPISEPDCGCEGKVNTLTLQYVGPETNAGYYITSKHGRKLISTGTVSTGDTFRVDGTNIAVDRKGTLGPWIEVVVNADSVSTIHTSCSVPIGPGARFGDFMVVEGTSRIAGALCPLPEGITN